jgi:hypothetical protein
MMVFGLAYFSALKMEATCSSKTSADFQRITWRYIPEYTINYFVSFDVMCVRVDRAWKLN